MESPEVNSPQIVQHERYFYADGSLALRAENVLYRVHQYQFTQHSTSFSEKVLVSSSYDSGTESFFLLDIASKDFDQLLSVLYPITFLSHAPETAEEWSAVLKLSTLWGFISIRELSIERLATLGTSIDKVVLGRQCDVNEWLLQAYKDICTRDSPLNLEEGKRLGLEDVIRIGEFRHALASISSIRIADAIVRHFRLGHLVESVALSAPRTPPRASSRLSLPPSQLPPPLAPSQIPPNALTKEPMKKPTKKPMEVPAKELAERPMNEWVGAPATEPSMEKWVGASMKGPSTKEWMDTSTKEPMIKWAGTPAKELSTKECVDAPVKEPSTKAWMDVKGPSTKEWMDTPTKEPTEESAEDLSVLRKTATKGKKKGRPLSYLSPAIATAPSSALPPSEQEKKPEEPLHNTSEYRA